MNPPKLMVQRALVRLKRLGYFPSEAQVREVLVFALQDIGTLARPEMVPVEREAAE